MPSFSDLSDDILFLLADYLRPERQHALHSLRLVSRRLKYFAESILYRTVVLEEDDEFQEQASYGLIQRILDPRDYLRHLIRFLHIRSFRGDNDSYCMNVELIRACLQKIRKLDLLRWDTAVQIPSPILGALRLFHPESELQAIIRSRDGAPLDMRNLRELSVSVPCSDISHPHSTKPFEQLRSLLISRDEMRAFSFDVHPDLQLRRMAYGPLQLCGCPLRCKCKCAQEDPLVQLFTQNRVQIPLIPGDKLPTLESLSIQARTYAFDTKHCTILCDALDLGRLRSLTLGSSHAWELFRHLTSRVPALQHLDIAYHYSPETYARHSVQKSREIMDTIPHFLASIDALRSFTFRCNDTTMTEPIWDILASQHDDSLQHVSIQPRCPDLEASPALDPDRLRLFLSNLPNLKHCAIALPTLQPMNRWGHCPYCHITSHPRHVAAIPAMPALETLHISVQMLQARDVPLHTDALAQAHCLIRTLWMSFRNTYPNDRTLERIEVTYWQWTAPMAHCKEFRPRAKTCISRVVFASWVVGTELMIKSRDERKAVVARFRETRETERIGGGEDVSVLEWIKYVPVVEDGIGNAEGRDMVGSVVGVEERERSASHLVCIGF